MVQIISAVAQSPRISANQLGEFVHGSEKKRLNILHDQKFGNVNAAPYYWLAHAAAHRSFSNGSFSSQRLIHEASILDQRPAETRRQAQKWTNNALALRRFA